MMKYYLSKSQLKDLFERDALVKVILPITEDVPFEPELQLPWARTVIADVDPRWIRRAGDIDIQVAINPAPARVSGAFADRFGEIIWPDRPYLGNGLKIEMTVVFVELSRSENPIYWDERPRWPRYVEVDGISIPRSLADS